MSDHIPDCIYDNEQFLLDDDITRREIYSIIGTLHDIASSIAFNFTADQFEHGATQWSHLKEPYATLYHKIKNLAAFAVGNKNILSIFPPQQANAKKKKLDTIAANAAMNSVSNASRALDAWYGQCRNKDSIVIHYETLFDAMITNQVAGYRIWVHSTITRVVPMVLPQSTNPMIVVPMQTLNDNRAPVDVLSAAMRHSLQEAVGLGAIYKSQRDRFISSKAKLKKQMPVAKLNADSALYSLYNYINSESLVKCVGNIFRRCLYSDPSRVSGERVDSPFPAFRDSRAVMGVHYNIEDYNNATTIVADIFTKEAAMFYHVRTANVMVEQRNLNNYVRAISRASAYDPNLLRDVAELVALGITDASITTYFNEQTTYQLRNDQVSAEFFHNMPLPHRIGAQLPTRQKAGFANLGDDQCDNTETIIATTTANNKKNSAGGSMLVLSEDGDDDDIFGDNLFGDDDEDDDTRRKELSSSTSSTSTRDIPDYVDEAWLAEHDLDGSIAARLFDVPVEYGYKESVLRPLGLHQVMYTVTAIRMLACRSSAFNSNDPSHHTEEYKRKFMDQRKERTIFLIQNTMLQNGGKPCSHHKLLACDHELPTNGISNATTNHNQSGADAVEAVTPQETYRASTLNYMVNRGCGMGESENGTNCDNAGPNDEESDDDEEEEEPGFRNEDGEMILNDEGVEVPVKPRFYRNRNLDELIPFLKRPNNPSYDPEWESFISGASLDAFLPILEKWRPKGNTMDDVHSRADIIRDEDWMLERDVYLRMCALNKLAFRALDRVYFDQKTRQIPAHKYAAYKTEKNRLITSMVIEVWNEFFTSPDVSYANEGVRLDWKKATVQIVDGKKRITHSHHTRVTRLDVLPYHQYKIWCYELFSVVLDVHYNYKIMYNNYTAKYHHCRWQVGSTDPKLNIINHGDNMGGKSFILTNVKKTCPSMIGDMVTQITDKAFHVDRNLNDMLIIIEEMENKYLGISTGPGRGAAGSGDSDALAFFKNRLTSGIASVIHFFLDEENNNRRDCKQAKSSCQGSYLCATNARLADADRHLLSRFTLQSVPKSFGDKSKNGPKAGSSDKKPEFGTETRQHEVIYEEHKDIHRLYYLTEQCIKSGTMVNNAYGVSIDGANLMISMILNKMHLEYGIPTDNGRKRNSIIEMARCMCIAYACWNALTSPALRHLQYDPMTGDYIGINPRVVLFGIMPHLVITKDMVIDSLTSLSGQWQHDHLKNVLRSIVVSTNLEKPVSGKYRLITESEVDTSMVDYSDPRNKVRRTGAVNAASGAMGSAPQQQPMRTRNTVGVSTQNGAPVYINATPDYNYVCLVERTYDMIYKNVSKQLGELQISSNDVEKILTELSEETFHMALPSYTLEKNADLADAAYGTLVLDTTNNLVVKSKIVIIDHCPKTRRPRVCVYIPYLKEEVPQMVRDSTAHDLPRYQTKQNRQQRHDDGNEEDDDDEEEDEEEEIDGEKDTTNEEDEDDDAANTDEDESGGDAMQQEDRARLKKKKKTTKKDAIVEEDTLGILIAKLEKLARFETRGEAPLIRAIMACYETSIKDVTCLPVEMDMAIRAEYASLYSRKVPWDRHATADNPASIMTADVYPHQTHIINHNKHIAKEITFYDTMKFLTLQRKGNEKVIIPNHSYVSPSAIATLSIFDPLITDNDVIKSTQNIYNHSSAWQLTEDIDFTCGKAHLANLCYQPLDTDDIRFRCINYQPFLYQVHTDYSRTRLARYKKSLNIEREVRRVECERTSDTMGLARIAKEIDDDLIASVMCEYPLCTMLSKVNHQGDIITSTQHGADANSVLFHEMILANCELMKADFELKHRNVIHGKKRMEYKDEESKQEARDKLHAIFKTRMRMTNSKKTAIASSKASSSSKKTSRKRNHAGLAQETINIHENLNSSLRKGIKVMSHLTSSL